MDDWSRRFHKDISRKDKKLIDSIYEKNKLKSWHTDDYKQLSSLSECLISLMTEPRWAPLLYTLERLEIEVEEEERGRFPILKEKAIKAIIEYRILKIILMKHLQKFNEAINPSGLPDCTQVIYKIEWDDLDPSFPRHETGQPILKVDSDGSYEINNDYHNRETIIKEKKRK